MRAMLGELKPVPQYFVNVLDLIQTVVNEGPCALLVKDTDEITQSSLQVMTGINPNLSVVCVLRSQLDPLTPFTLDE